VRPERMRLGAGENALTAQATRRDLEGAFVNLFFEAGGAEIAVHMTNAGAAEFSGLEIEGTAFVNERLSFTGSLGLLDAKYTEFFVNGVNEANNRAIQNAPEVTGNITANYTMPLELGGIDGDLSLIGGVSYRDDTQQFEVAQPLLDEGAYYLYDASIVWNSADGKYSAGIFGRNLTDEEYVTTGYNFPTVDNSVLQFYGNPRQITATVKLRY